jgi:acetylornithine/succinyldiaminopimelate/putrescine aminotransferase
MSQVCHDAYRAHLASFQGHRHPKVYVAKMNDIPSLQAAFDHAEADGCFVELLGIEPVMGEGIPGLAVTREFYDHARQLTLQKNALLLMDSIQAGLRCSGTLSIVDYPGFESADAPDFETFSKALNGGQYPLSVLALGPRTYDLYKCGTYGNTMTGNPRALDIGAAILQQV